MLIIHLLLVGMLVSAGDPNKGPSQNHHQDLYTVKHCLLSQLPLYDRTAYLQRVLLK